MGSLTNYLTKREIIKRFEISLSTYKNRLNELKSNSEYSAMTKVIKLEINPQSKRKTPTRIIHSSIVERFFSKRRHVLSIIERKRVLAKKTNWTFIATVMPEGIKREEMKMKISYLFQKLKGHYSKGEKLIYGIEDNPKANGIHAHILIKTRKSRKKVKELFSLYLTGNYQFRVEVEPYNYELYKERGIDYFLKGSEVFVPDTI